MRRPVLALALAALAIASCGVDEGDLTDDPPSQDGVDVEDMERVEPGEIGPDTDLFGVRFEGLWRFEQHTEVALVLEPGAAAGDLADELRARAGVAAVDELAVAAVEDRVALGALLPPGAAAPPVLLVTADDRGTALSLAGLVQRDRVAHALIPSCDALAGSARLQGRQRAQELLDAAMCDQIVIVAANSEAATPWVAAAGLDEGAICVAAAVQDGHSATSSSTCSESPDDPGVPVASLVGGFVVGFAPSDTATVELEAGEQRATVRPVTVAEGAASAYAAYLPEPDAGDGAAGKTRPVADVTWRFLDDGGAVIDQG